MKSLLVCLLLFVAAVYSPRQVRSYTVGDVLRHARQLSNDSTTVKINGYITKKVGSGVYLFEDRTAEIYLYAEDKYLPEKPFDERVALVVQALVQYEYNKPITLRANKTITSE
ncbi:NirD/YgiW/YdeI family stress tolerance protein [Chitinophaga vietnamensis]|uniref:NirD/YgiW/YdeI family stress tolerance protein n=1 Tax=Chitinophaga vietnamensis TaxID=2593957 RepID=UPI0011785694|nr:NirD/YgiW/YdeI family stress tolerance protein [Chitinophaga vietnamensis]